MGNQKIINGEAHVWDIFENAWVTEAYWEWVNGRGTSDPAVRTHATSGA